MEVVPRIQTVLGPEKVLGAEVSHQCGGALQIGIVGVVADPQDPGHDYGCQFQELCLCRLEVVHFAPAIAFAEYFAEARTSARYFARIGERMENSDQYILDVWRAG